jgi:hypothetical protein
MKTLLRFIQWEPVVEAFDRVVVEYERHSAYGLLAMRGIVATVMWRTTKDVAERLRLPQLTVHTLVSF